MPTQFTSPGGEFARVALAGRRVELFEGFRCPKSICQAETTLQAGAMSEPWRVSWGKPKRLKIALIQALRQQPFLRIRAVGMLRF